LAEVTVLGEDGVSIVSDELVDFRIGNCIKPDVDDVFRVRESVRQTPKWAPWKILVKKKLHQRLDAGRRSRLAAN
jgi:hypothetical protein